VNKAADSWGRGKVLRCSSSKFGTADILCIQVPSRNIEERRRGAQLRQDGDVWELLYHSSFENDVVEKEWPTLKAYWMEMLDDGEPKS
jgi:hypothetical protein